VTAPLYLVEPAELVGVSAGGALVLDGEEGHHAATVRRTRVGETILVADGAGRLARCVVEAVAARQVSLRVQDVEVLAPARPRLVLVQALAKGGRDELAVETATELGVDAVVPWQADRSVVVWSGERGERSRRKWESVARAAAKQARRGVVPEIRPTLSTPALAAASRDVGAGAAAEPSVTVLVLHEEARESLTSAALPAAGVDGEVWIVVGPEGGISADELTTLTSAGAVAVRLGPFVLRSSSAGAAALAVLSARLGRWGRALDSAGAEVVAADEADG
jgi:16S rRNA (uracil1498-N3)-methyltransferase